MDSLVYLVRSSVDRISPFLYSKSTAATVVTVEQAPLAGRVLESSVGSSRQKGTALSYGELLELLMKSQRIITL